MAKGKRSKRETIRSMAVDPTLLDPSVWQQSDPSPDAAGAAEPEPGAQADPERD